jgi:hypothetical protein
MPTGSAMTRCRGSPVITPTAFNQRAETPDYQVLDDIGQSQQVQLPTE